MYQIPKETLAKVLSGFRTLKLSRANLPVLQCLKIEVKAGKVRLCGTNLDDHLRCRLENAETTLDSEPLLVPFTTLQEAVRAADKNTPVRIERGRVRIRASGTEMARSYEQVDVTEFSSWSEAAGETEIVLKPGVIETLAEARIAASTDPTRHVLCGIHITENTVVATNGRRLIVRNLDRAHRLQGVG